MAGAPGKQTEPSGAERRVHPRIPVEGTVRYRLMRGGQSGLRQETSRLHNVSTGGVCLSGAAGIRPGDILRIEFTLPDGDGPVSALAEVTWAGPSGSEAKIGARYVAIREDQARSVTEFVSKKLASN